MLLGWVKVDPEKGVIRSHRGWYAIGPNTAATVTQPMLAGGIVAAAGCAGFALMFADLLFPEEMFILIGAAIVALIIGVKTGRLNLVSRDLRMANLSTLAWGTTGELKRINNQISDAVLRHGDEANE